MTMRKTLLPPRPKKPKRLWTKKRAQEFCLWFGHYRGVKFAELLLSKPGMDYLDWLALRADQVKPEVKIAALIVLGRTTAKTVNADFAEHQTKPLFRGMK
jgi:hypothetical protein